MLVHFLISVALAADPDNFTGRNTPPQNEVVNLYIQSKLQKNIADVYNAGNSGKSECDKKQIDELMHDSFDKNSPDIFQIRWEAHLDGPETYDSSVLAGTFPHIPGDLEKNLFIPSVTLKLNGKTNSVVGIDKIDHLFSHGYANWKIVGEDPALPEGKVKNALQLGIDQENGPWGSKGMGIKSYGDLSANYLGMFFWRDLWNGKPAFFKCESGKLIVDRKFKIEDYLDASVDEAVNCSSYRDQEMANTIIKRTKDLHRKCPLDAETCLSLTKKRPSYVQEATLHPLCRGLTHNQIEAPGAKTSKDILDAGTALLSGTTNLYTLFFGEKESNKKASKGITGVPILNVPKPAAGVQ